MILLLITMKELTPENVFVFLWEPIIFIVKTTKNNFLEIKYGYWKITLRWLLRMPVVRLGNGWD
jgi:hypothetical protein